MLLVFAVVGAAAILSLIEIPRLLKRRWIKETWAFAAFLFAGVVLCVLTILHVPLPNPIFLLRTIYSPVSGAIDSLLGLK